MTDQQASAGASVGTTAAAAAAGAGSIVLLTLASGQFLMTLDSSVMNVSIATVAKDVGTTVTGIQTAITLYTLVMASLMITGGKVGQILGRKRAFAIGCVIYGAGSFTTAISQSLGVLILGWSFLEGVGAALIMPAIVALVASNFGRPERPRAYGLVASAGAIAVAAGPLIGGFFTTYLSWRLVFAGEVLVVLAILALTRRMDDAPPEGGVKLDLVGTGLSATGLALVVLAILKAGEWGIVRPKSDEPEWLGLSPVIWMLLGGALVLWLFFEWEGRVIERGGTPLVDPEMLKVTQLRAGLTSFFFQYLIQMGLFFVVPLYLSVALGLTAIDTGVRLLPLSVTLLLAAAGIPKLLPNVSPRRVVRFGFVALFLGLVTLIAALEEGAGPEIVTVPMLLAGLGIGALASQLGSVTVSAVPDEQSGEVGGVQNTFTNLGASIGTALAGAVLIAILTTSFLTGIEQNPAVPHDLSSKAQVELSSGVPFISDEDLEAALDDAGVSGKTADAVVDENETARLQALRASLAILALLSLVALFFTRRIPTVQPAAQAAAAPAGAITMTRALVLSGGGPVGIAWESGVTIGLAEGGARLAEADLVVGTSAGSAVGAQIALGRDLNEQVERYRAIDPSQAAERSLLARDAPPERMAQLIEMMTEVMTGDTDSDEARARIGKFALESEAFPEDDFVAGFGYLAGEEWPRGFACTAVDAESGALVVWDGGNRAPLERAVASSCAVPGLFPPITIDGRRYIDGGMRSPTNADLAEGNDRVLLLSLIPPTSPDVDDPRAARFGQRLADELATITDAGGAVEIVTPDEEAQAVMGMNLMDPTVNLPAAEAGIRQGRAIADFLAGFWVA